MVQKKVASILKLHIDEIKTPSEQEIIIVLIGGGSGGHTIPMMSFAQTLREHNINFFLFTDHRGAQYIDTQDKNTEVIVPTWSWSFYNMYRQYDFFTELNKKFRQRDHRHKNKNLWFNYVITIIAILCCGVKIWLSFYFMDFFHILNVDFYNLSTKDMWGVFIEIICCAFVLFSIVSSSWFSKERHFSGFKILGYVGAFVSMIFVPQAYANLLWMFLVFIVTYDFLKFFKNNRQTMIAPQTKHIHIISFGGSKSIITAFFWSFTRRNSSIGTYHADMTSNLNIIVARVFSRYIAYAWPESYRRIKIFLHDCLTILLKICVVIFFTSVMFLGFFILQKNFAMFMNFIAWTDINLGAMIAQINTFVETEKIYYYSIFKKECFFFVSCIVSFFVLQIRSIIAMEFFKQDELKLVTSLWNRLLGFILLHTIICSLGAYFVSRPCFLFAFHAMQHLIIPYMICLLCLLNGAKETRQSYIMQTMIFFTGWGVSVFGIYSYSLVDIPREKWILYPAIFMIFYIVSGQRNAYQDWRTILYLWYIVMFIVLLGMKNILLYTESPFIKEKFLLLCILSGIVFISVIFIYTLCWGLIYLDNKTNIFNNHLKESTVGMLLKPSFLNILSSQKEFLELPRNKDIFTLLILGGSQGSMMSAMITQFIIELPDESKKNLCIMQQCRRADLHKIQHLYKKHKIECDLFSFDPNLEQRYLHADGIIARAGAGTIAELQMLKKPFLLIPLNAAHGHQIINAKMMQEHNQHIQKIFILENEIELYFNQQLLWWMNNKEHVEELYKTLDNIPISHHEQAAENFFYKIKEILHPFLTPMRLSRNVVIYFFINIIFLY